MNETADSGSEFYEEIPKPFRMPPHSAEMALFLFECFLMDRKIPYTRKTDDPFVELVFGIKVDHIQVIKFSFMGLDYVVTADLKRNENFVLMYRDGVSVTHLVYRFDEITTVRTKDNRIVRIAVSGGNFFFLWALEDWLKLQAGWES